MLEKRSTMKTRLENEMPVHDLAWKGIGDVGRVVLRGQSLLFNQILGDWTFRLDCVQHSVFFDRFPRELDGSSSFVKRELIAGGIRKHLAPLTDSIATYRLAKALRSLALGGGGGGSGFGVEVLGLRVLV